MASVNNSTTPTDERLASLSLQVQGMKNRRIKNNSHVIYNGKVKKVVDWVKLYPELKAQSLDANDKLILPLPVKTVEMFFANVVVKEATEDIRTTLATIGK